MATDATATSASSKIDLTALTHLRPVEIKTYHQTTYDRISPSNTFDGKDKTVLITGGASGIGFSIAESFAKASVQHLVLVQRRQEVLSKAREELEAKFPNTSVTTYAASVTDYDRISAIIKEVGKIDVLVSNVATSHPFVPSGEISTADYKLTFDTNVIGTFHIIKEFLALPSSGPRVVVNVSSAAGQIVQPGNIGYGPSKAVGNQIIQHLAQEYAGTNVTFQTFHPGVIRTEYAAKLSGEDAFDWEDARLPGDFAVWLASPEASFLAGKFVWAQWDIDELLTVKARLEANPTLLSTTVVV